MMFEISEEMQQIIDQLPENPQLPILYVVYNDDMIKHAVMAIIASRGLEYFDTYVTVRAANTDTTNYMREYPLQLVYIDPTVFKYANNGYN